MKKDAEARIESEFLAARVQLEREIVEKATAAAETLLKDQTTSVDHSNLFSGFIGNLNSSTAQENRDGGAS